MNFQLTRDQVVHLETAANLGASRRQAKKISAVFFSIFRVGRYNGTLNDWPARSSDFCFPQPYVPLGCLDQMETGAHSYPILLMILG